MAILLTNGDYYIAHNKTGAVIKVTDRSQAQDFYTIEKAIKQAYKTPGKCKNYYWIDTEAPEIEESVVPIIVKKKSKKIKKKSAVKRKCYSKEQRRTIYNKSGGFCQLCGRKINYNDFTVDHITPISKGGSNDMDNVEAVCRVCNQFKANIYPEQFVDRITEIFMFQMEKQYGDNSTWKMARNMLMEIL